MALVWEMYDIKRFIYLADIARARGARPEKLVSLLSTTATSANYAVICAG
jgi:hypothetical protein